ncbi:MAG: type II secretion system F family protein [Candidatus Aenigmarchaeota archaeon]|nr:type II secretion system F family protein [Candidatus Aenigmarchaeota archaeon]
MSLDKFYNSMVKKCGRIGARYLSRYTSPLKEELLKSNLGILYEVYIGKMVFYSSAAGAAAFAGVFFLFSALFNVPLWMIALSALVGGLAAFFAVLFVSYSYPFQLLSSKKSSIEGNMPFAINHMAAISSSGVPPFVIFKLLMDVKEYGEVSNEFKRIVRNIDAFGMDVGTAVRNVADRTPSEQFRQFLYGIISTITTGGDLKRYLENSGKDALFDYKLKREKYLQTLSTYADFYTAVLIAAPLFFVSILSVMSLIGGSVGGLSITTAMRLGIYLLIPLLNSLFIMFIHYTQPKI